MPDVLHIIMGRKNAFRPALCLSVPSHVVSSRTSVGTAELGDANVVLWVLSIYICKINHQTIRLADQTQISSSCHILYYYCCCIPMYEIHSPIKRPYDTYSSTLLHRYLIITSFINMLYPVCYLVWICRTSTSYHSCLRRRCWQGFNPCNLGLILGFYSWFGVWAQHPRSCATLIFYCVVYSSCS